MGPPNAEEVVGVEMVAFFANEAQHTTLMEDIQEAVANQGCQQLMGTISAGFPEVARRGSDSGLLAVPKRAVQAGRGGHLPRLSGHARGTAS